MARPHLSAILALLVLCSTATADKRAGSEGEWRTGDFAEPTFVTRWGYGATDQASINKVTADLGDRSGAGVMKLDTTSGFDTWLYFPNTKDLDFDASECAALRFSMRTENKNGWGGDPWVIFKDMQGRFAQFNGTRNRLTDTLKGWVDFTIPLGPALKQAADESAKYLAVEERKRGPAPVEWLLRIEKGFDWKRIGSVEFHADTGGYGFLMWLDGVEFVGAAPSRWWLSSLDKCDLSVTWAEQFPHYHRYSVDYQNGYPELSDAEKKAKRYPDPGELVTYEVHVKNVGFLPSPPTDFVCTVDGRRVGFAAVPSLKPREETVVKAQWRYRAGPRRFVARVDTGGRIDEISEKNNTLTFNTDAYMLFAICEKGMTEQVDAVNSLYSSFSFEDWMRGCTVDTMNRLFKHSKYDFAPDGAKISVRIGAIYVVDKIEPDTQSKLDVLACDGGWSYGSAGAMEYTNLANSYMWALCHELTHQLGIIDDYQFDLPAANNKVNGKPFGQPDGGMMGGGHIRSNDPPAYADLDVVGMNTTYGKRRGYFGEYLFNVPDKNTLALYVDGSPLTGAQVSVYQKDMNKLTIEGDPVHVGETDMMGRLELANRPVPKEYVTDTGGRLKPNPFGLTDVVGRNGLFLVRATKDGRLYFAFIDIGHFVVEYARGNRRSATYRLEMTAE